MTSDSECRCVKPFVAACVRSFASRREGLHERSRGAGRPLAGKTTFEAKGHLPIAPRRVVRPRIADQLRRSSMICHRGRW